VFGFAAGCSVSAAFDDGRQLAVGSGSSTARKVDGESFRVKTFAVRVHVVIVRTLMGFAALVRVAGISVPAAMAQAATGVEQAQPVPMLQLSPSAGPVVILMSSTRRQSLVVRRQATRDRTKAGHSGRDLRNNRFEEENSG